MLKHGIAAAVVGAALVWILAPRAAYPHNPTTTTVLFNREISTLLQRKCVQCHADGKLAMPLVTYDQARPWAESIKQEVLARRMPPWPAERGYGTFANDIGLTPREFEFLISWIDGGVPVGPGEAPALVDHGSHWMLGEPDLVVTSSRPIEIAPRSAPAFTRLTIDTGLARDAWLRGFDFKPDPRVTRAAFLRIAGTNGDVGGWTPWQSSMELPRGVAIKLPARAQLTVDVMYSGASERVSDTPRLGLYFAPASPDAIVKTTTLRSSVDPRNPARMVAELKVAATQALVSMRPELPPAAHSFEVRVVRPDGSRDVLLWVKDIQHAWPTPYVFRTPATLPAGSTLQAIAYGDATAPFTITVNHYAQN